MTVGSDDEFEDITCGEKERDEYGSTENDTNSSDFQLPSTSNIPPTPSPSPTLGPVSMSTVTATHASSPTPASTSALAATHAPSPTAASTSTLSATHAPSPTPGPASTRTPTEPCWTTTLSPIDISPFIQPVGPTVPIPESPGEVFDLFFTDEICTVILQQSNLYAQEVLGQRYSVWEKLTMEELRAYFGFMILMGLYPRPSLSDYWKRDPFVNYAPIAERISRDRFYDISRYLHFSNNALQAPPGATGYDRLGKVRDIMQRVSERFLTLYKPHCENAIDEAMIPFQGRSSLKQYMPAKPVKRGIKVWCRADSHNGYLCEFQVYTGKSSSVQNGLGKRVVLELSQNLHGMHHHLYFDNFFSSVPLLLSLLDSGLYACGTARHTYRGFPSALKMKGKSKSEMTRHGLMNR